MPHTRLAFAIALSLQAFTTGAETLATLSVTASGPGSVSSNPTGILCGVDCSEDYTLGTPVTVTALANFGKRFLGWSGDCSGTSATCTLTMDQEHAVAAYFGDASTRLPLIVTLVGQGVVTSSPDGIDCGIDCDETYDQGTEVRLSANPEPGWQFSGWGGACTGTAECLLTIREPSAVTANFTALTNRYQLDSPVNGSFESGIGVVHGWVCEATEVRLQVDGFDPFAAARGAERTDSQDVCGDTANGFAAAINWADYGDGMHTLTLLADGQALTQASVTVTTLGSSFLRGLEARTMVPDFPSAGLDTLLEWSEPHQNFVVGVDSPVSSDISAFSADRSGNWESPLAGGLESGQALIRGWVCSATSINATLDDEPLTLPYGSERLDTQSLCNDSDNGYALAINWNDYQDGLHQLSLIRDGSLVETRTFTTATPAGQGRITGIQGRHVIADFPHPGDQLSLQWSEPHQNFRLIDYQASNSQRDTAWKVTEIYIATLGYAPDNEGLQYWIEQVDEDPAWTPTSVAQSFFDSPLVQAEYPSSAGDEELIAALYTNIFGRAPDAEGLAYWLSELSAAHVSRNQMIIALIEGGWANPEASLDMARFGNRVQVGLAFAAAQAKLGILYSQLSDTDQTRLREIGANLIQEVTADTATRDDAISTISDLLTTSVSTIGQ